MDKDKNVNPNLNRNQGQGQGQQNIPGAQKGNVGQPGQFDVNRQGQQKPQTGGGGAINPTQTPKRR